MEFLYHICLVDRVKKRNTLYQYLLQFKMMFNLENGHYIDTNDANDALKVRLRSLAVPVLPTLRC
jgi:hypothetical protein